MLTLTASQLPRKPSRSNAEGSDHRSGRRCRVHHCAEVTRTQQRHQSTDTGGLNVTQQQRMLVLEAIQIVRETRLDHRHAGYTAAGDRTE